MTTRIAASDWAHYAATKPDAVVYSITIPGETETWQSARVGQLAYALRHKLKLSPGDRIVNLSDGDIRHFELLRLRARGLVWVPLNFTLTAAELADLTRSCRPD